MKNFLEDYKEIISDAEKPNFIKVYLEKQLNRSRSELQKKIIQKPRDLIYENLPPIDKDPNLTRHRANIIESRIAFDKSAPINLNNSRDVSCYLDSKTPNSTNNIHENFQNELLVNIGVKESSPVFHISTDLNELKKQLKTDDMMFWSLETSKDIDFTNLSKEFIQSGISEKSAKPSKLSQGGPSKRKEVEILGTWLNLMLKKISKENNQSKEEMLENAQVIYTSCLKEIFRQISVHCTERGELLKRVWKSYFGLMVKTINFYQNSKILLQEKFKADMYACKQKHLKEIDIYDEKLTKSEEKIKDLENVLDEQNLKLNKSTIKCEQLKHRLIAVQSQYHKDKFKLMRLEDEYKNLKQVQMIVLEEIDENIPGIKKVQAKSKIRFRELSKFFLADPLCGNLTEVTIPENPTDPETIIVLDKIDLENKIKMHKIQRKIDETAEELVDKSLDTNDLLKFKDKDAFTSIEDFDIDVVGVYSDKHVPIDLRTIETILIDKLNKESWTNQDLENYFGGRVEIKNNYLGELKLITLDIYNDYKELLQKISIKNHKTGALVHKITLNNRQKSVEDFFSNLSMQNQQKFENLKRKIEDLDEKMKSNQVEIIDLRKQAFISYKSSTKYKEELANSKEELDKVIGLNKRRNLIKKPVVRSQKKKTTVIQEFKLNRKVVLFSKDKVSAAQEIFNKLTFNKENKNQVSIRLVTLIKLINTILLDYATQMKEDLIVKTQPLHIYVYDHFASKHGGAKKIVEAKYKNFLSALDHHKSNIQVNLFCRFIGFFDPLEIEYFRIYLTILDYLQKYNRIGVDLTQSETEDALVPLIRCAEVVSSFFKEKFLDSKVNSIKSELVKISKPCPRGINQGVVERCEFVLLMIKHYKNYLQLAINDVKDLFDAADLNGDNFLQFDEFDMLFRSVEHERYNPWLSLKYFESYSDLIAEMNGENYPAISYEKFRIFALEKDYFRIEVQNRFIKETDLNEIMKKIQILHNKNWQIISELKWRIKRVGKELPGYLEMIETLKKKLQDNEKKRSVYMAYKIIDYDTKFQVVQSEIEKFLPSISFNYEKSSSVFLGKSDQYKDLKRKISWKASTDSLSDWEEKV